MGPKVKGACRFVRETGRRSVIGRLRHLQDVVEGRSGTLISNEIDGIVFKD
jgi:carbamate kinase